MYAVTCWASYPLTETREYKWPIQCKAVATDIRELVQISSLYNTPIWVSLWSDGLAYIYLGNHTTGFMVPEPEKYLEFTPETDYGSFTPAQVRAALNVPQGTEAQSIVPLEMEGALSANDVQEQKTVQEEAIDKVKQQIEATKQCETKELAALKAEIEAKQRELEAKKSAMMQQLKEKLEELETMKYDMENQIFMLESQIYAIRCFAGETVKFTQITSGQNAPDTEPIVVHQKLHFLDEDLGRLASIYTIHWEDTSMFEEFLKHSPLALDTFAPNQRCISLVRLSKDGKKIMEDQEIPYHNLLEKYNYYHGKTIGIIIRNGENLYLGWTDQERIDIEDDLIISRVIKETEPAPIQESHFESDRQNWIKQRCKERRQLMEGMASRSFVYNIAQGVVERTPILPLPEGVTLAKQSEYVVSTPWQINGSRITATALSMRLWSGATRKSPKVTRFLPYSGFAPKGRSSIRSPMKIPVVEAGPIGPMTSAQMIALSTLSTWSRWTNQSPGHSTNFIRVIRTSSTKRELGTCPGSIPTALLASPGSSSPATFLFLWRRKIPNVVPDPILKYIPVNSLTCSI